MRNLIISFAVSAGAMLVSLTALAGEDGSLYFSDEAPGIVEIDTSGTTQRSVDGATGHALRAVRRADGGRDVRHWDGSSWADFLIGAFPLDMHATHANGMDLVCAPVATSFPSVDEILSECGVRTAAGFPAADRIVFQGEPSSFIRDVCPTQSGFEVLVLQYANPVGVPKVPTDPPASGCASFEWSSDGGWEDRGFSGTCFCDLREGSACENPCYAGSATWRDGQCVADDEATFVCDDGDPFTKDVCSGVVTRCTADHPDWGQTISMTVPEVGDDGEVHDIELEIACPDNDPGCNCSCLEGDVGCEVVTDSGELIDAMCEHIQLEPTTGIFMRGDANGDDTVNLTDAVFIFNYLFNGGPEPGCGDAADANDDGVVNLTDGVHVLNYLYSGGPAPAAPFDRCGVDDTPSDLTCLQSTGTCCEFEAGGC